MRHLAVVVILALSVVVGCASTQRINSRFSEKLAAWKLKHPGETPTDEIRAALYEEAETEVAAEVAEERKKALEAATSAGINFATGNVAGGVMALLAIAGLFFGGKKQQKAVMA